MSTESAATSEAWLQVEIVLPAGSEDAAEDLLGGLLPDLGATGIEFLDAPRRLRATFRTAAGPGALADEVRGLTEAVGLGGLPVAAQAIAEEAWAPHWDAAFEPLRFGPLAIVPSWAAAPADAERVLVIDPSQAFGTGLHPTTTLCLDWLVAQPSLGTVLDVGTGTGVLSLAALALGAPSAIGVDVDPVAIEAARVAAERSRVDGLELKLGTVEAVEGRFDVVLANVRPGPLLEMAEALLTRVAGALVLCGMRSHEVAAVEAKYTELGFDVVGRAARDDWVRLELHRAS